MEQPVQGIYVFDDYQLDTITRRLTRDGAPIKLGARLFDALLYFVEHSGRVVSQDELEQAIWPGRKMERGNVARAISSLRTALKAEGTGEQIIITLPGRGYRFGALTTFARCAAPLEPLERLASPESANIAITAVPRTLQRQARRGRLVAGTAAAFGMAALLAIGWHLADQGSNQWSQPPPRSIAVLPFTNVSGDPHQDYLSDGLTDELINSLSNIGPLLVAARTSSSSFKGKTPNAHQVAAALNVANVLDGTVRRFDQRLVVTAELIDSRTGYQLWSHRYDLDKHGFLPTERQIFVSVARTLQIPVPGDASSTRATGGTDNPAALDLYMRAMSMLRNDESHAFQPAYDALSQAVRLDPDYAMALAQRARLLVNWHSPSPEALADADHAVEVAPELGFAHSTLGRVLSQPPFDYARAKTEFVRALELAPHDAATLLDYGTFEVTMGEFEQGLSSARQAIALDTLTARTHIRFALLSALSGRFEDAATALRHAAILGGDLGELQRSKLALIQTWQGSAKAALETCRPRRDWHDLLCLAIAYHRLGDQGQADDALTKMRSALGDEGAYNFAEVYAALGKPEEAIRWLGRAMELKDAGLYLLRADPLLLALHGTPAFTELEKRLGFPSVAK